MRAKKILQNLFIQFLILLLVFTGSKNVYAQCTANFVFTPNPTCEGYLVQFTDISTPGSGTIISWQWDFGDGSTSNLQNSTHIYSASGIYTVELIINTSLGCSDTNFSVVQVNPLPGAYAGQDTTSCEGVPFDLSTLNNPPIAFNYTSIYWYGGQGTFNDPSLLAPIYTPAANEFNIIVDLYMVAYGIMPCANDTSMMSIYIVQGAYAFAGSDEHSCQGEPFDFATSASPPQAYNENYRMWSGGTGYFIDPTVEVPIYVPGSNELGPIQLSFVASNIMNCDSTDDMILTINPVYFDTTYVEICYGDSLQLPGGSWVNTTGLYYDSLMSVWNCDSIICNDLYVYSEIFVDFTFSPIDPDQGDTVYFTDQSSSSNGYITQWIWYFGDGDSAVINYPDNPDVEHVYSDSGSYQATLSVMDSVNCTNDTTKTINVFQGNPIYPVADFSYEYTCLNLYTQFTDLSSVNGGSPLASWFWDFDDPASGNNTSTLQNPEHLFSISGNFDVSLVVTNADNLSDTVIKTLNAYPLPDVSITASPDSAMPGTPIQFYGNANVSTIISWNWNFGDGVSSTLQNPVHTYQDLGMYNVSLSVTDTSSCTNTAYTGVYIYSTTVFPDDSAIWNTVGANGITGETWRFRYGLIGDTTISITDLDTSYAYTKVYKLYDSTLTSPYSTYFAAIRTTDDNKVYALIPGFEETLLYNFTLDIGDTAWFGVGGVIFTNVVMFEDQDHYKVVTGIDSILLENNEYRKRWYLESQTSGIYDEWVEGVGSIVWYGLFNPLIFGIALNGDSYTLACLKENNIIVYLNNPQCEECFCQLLTSLEEIMQNDFNNLNIFPNPARNSVHISTENIVFKYGTINIYNSSGQCIYQNRIDAGSLLSIDVNHWKSGVYFVKVLDIKHVIGDGKFVVE